MIKEIARLLFLIVLLFSGMTMTVHADDPDGKITILNKKIVRIAKNVYLQKIS